MAPTVQDRPGPTVPDQPIRPPSRLRLVDDVARALEDAILSGAVRPGDRLIETRMCDELGVSRTTLREALLTLQRRGLVRSEPRRGTFVHRLSRSESLDLRRARSVLEGYVVSAGLNDLTDGDFRAMQGLIDEMAVCEFPRDVARIIRLDLDFHGTIMGAVPSPVILELWQSLNGRMSALILSSIERHRAGTPDFATFHQVLLDALRTGRTTVATDAVVAHYIGLTQDDNQSLAEITRAIDTMIHVPAQPA
jgi:DNA-binding GntR family transcriptional regulator